MAEPRWLSEQGARYLHDRAIRISGGMPGLRDRHLVSASMARPRFKHRYEGADLFACAAAYAFAFAGNHPFHDGNKRTVFGAPVTILMLNEWVLEAETEECVDVMLDVATGCMKEGSLASWVRERVARM